MKKTRLEVVRSLVASQQWTLLDLISELAKVQERVELGQIILESLEAEEARLTREIT